MLHQSCITFASILTYWLIKRFYCREFCRGEFIEYHYQNVHRTKKQAACFFACRLSKSAGLFRETCVAAWEECEAFCKASLPAFLSHISEQGEIPYGFGTSVQEIHHHRHIVYICELRRVRCLCPVVIQGDFQGISIFLNGVIAI